MKSADSNQGSGVKFNPAHYLLATALPVVACAVRVSLAAYLAPPYVLFFPAVIVAAVVGGLGPGLWATLLSALLAWYWVLEPVQSYEIRQWSDAGGLLLFACVGAFLSLVLERYRRSLALVASLEGDRAMAEAEAVSRNREELALRRSEDAAKRKAKELQAVLDTVPAAVFIAHDRQSRRMETNRFGATLLKVPIDSNISKSAPPGEAPANFKAMKDGAEIPPDRLPVQMAASSGEAVRDYQFDIVMENGVVRNLLGNAAPILDDTGQSSGAVAAFIDVTDMKAAEAARGQSEARFRALVENALDMIVVLDGEGRVTFASPNVAENFGRPIDVVLGQSLFDFAHPEDQPGLKDAFSALVATPGATINYAVRLSRKDGSWRRAEGVARNLLQEPAVRGVVVNARDVTEQRRMEELFQHAQKLESVGRLAGGVAHDFNNLLTVILAGAHEIRSDLESGSRIDPEIVEDVAAAGERARMLTSQLLTFARKQPIAPAPVDINQVVGKSESALRRMLGEDVELQVALQPGLWSTFCDPGQVEQVVLNLAVNARDAMPNGGKLIIETKNAEVVGGESESGPEDLPGQWVRLFVRDTGAGMSPAIKAHLFEPFFTTKARGKGTGLGLATVHGIVHQAGGHLHVASEPGLGTTFEVCFPRKEGNAPAIVESEEVSPRGGTETVLVVEDDQSVRALTVRTLRKKGFQVLVAENGQGVRELSDEQVAQVHLLVTDIVMPGTNGRDVAAELRRRHPGLPVLFVSGYAADAFVDGSALDSRSGFLAKPFSAPTLLRSVRELIDRA